MKKTRIMITMICCLFILALFALAQAFRKPGLWEITATMTWQQSPMPQGMTMPGGGPHTTQVCLTQAWIDRYGAPIPQANKDCKIINVVLHATSMTADMVCSGRMAGKANMESSWPDPNHAIGKMHFTGVMQAGQNSMPVEYIVNSSSVYKGPDCGNVAPPPMPQN